MINYVVLMKQRDSYDLLYMLLEPKLMYLIRFHFDFDYITIINYFIVYYPVSHVNFEI